MGAPVPLWRVIMTADALHKAIISRDELECGIGRLVSAEFICVVTDGFEALPKALALKAPGPPVEIVSKAIKAQGWSPQSKMPKTHETKYISLDAYDEALKMYRKEFRKFRKLGK
jgi:hypothetical protein